MCPPCLFCHFCLFVRVLLEDLFWFFPSFFIFSGDPLSPFSPLSRNHFPLSHRAGWVSSIVETPLQCIFYHFKSGFSGDCGMKLTKGKLTKSPAMLEEMCAGWTGVRILAVGPTKKKLPGAPGRGPQSFPQEKNPGTPTTFP